MKILVVGAGGLLGQSIVKVTSRETAWELLKVSRNSFEWENNIEEFDSQDYKAWKKLIDNIELKPDVIINTAAMTDVDKCETEREEAWRKNVNLVEVLVQICRGNAIKLIQLSTDYVFDGRRGPYIETDTPNPINYYGRTKLAAENLCVRKLTDYAIIRTMWLYGEANGGKQTFVDWVLRMLASDNDFGVVTDEIGNPTLTDEIAYAIIKILEQNYVGTIHIAGADRLTRWQFAQQIAQTYRKDPSVIREITTKELSRNAPRPLNSGLVTNKAQAILGLQPTSSRGGLELLRTMSQRQLIQ